MKNVTIRATFEVPHSGNVLLLFKKSAKICFKMIHATTVVQVLDTCYLSSRSSMVNNDKYDRIIQRSRATTVLQLVAHYSNIEI